MESDAPSSQSRNGDSTPVCRLRILPRTCRSPSRSLPDCGRSVPTGIPARCRHTGQPHGGSVASRDLSAEEERWAAPGWANSARRSPANRRRAKGGLRVVDQATVRPVRAGGKFEMCDGTAAAARGIVAVYRAKGTAAGWLGGDRFSGVIEALFGRRREHSEVCGFRRR